MAKKVKSKFHFCPLKILTAYWRYSVFNCTTVIALALVISMASPIKAIAQVDSLLVLETGEKDTTQIKRLDPRKALLYSAVLPGLGQVYNGKYWKLPFVYGGFGVTIYVVSFYQKAYHKFSDQLFRHLGGAAIPGNRSEQNLRFVVDKARRQRDYYTIITGVWYLLQVVDAHVDAHLQEFKWNKDLRLSLEPSIQQNMLTGRTTGLSLTFKF